MKCLLKVCYYIGEVANMNKIKLLREELNISQEELANKLGLSKGIISLYENEKRKPSFDILNKLSKIFNCSIDYIIGNWNEAEPTLINVYSSVHAGILSEMIENIVDTEEISEKMARSDKTYFGLKVKGDSMFPTYQEGDTLIVEKNTSCESGNDCIVAINGNEAFLKRVYINCTGITLQALNPKYEPLTYTNEDVKKLPVTIIGIVRELRRKI